MATKNPRINVTFDESVAALLSKLAGHENKSISGLVRELTLEALDRREDYHISQIATKRDDSLNKTFSHDEAWS